MKKTIIILLVAIILIGLAAPVAQAKDYGPFIYATTVASGYEDDTLLIPEIYAYIGTTDLVGKFVYISRTTDLAAPQNSACQILEYTASSGTLILDKEVEGAGNDASLGLSATITVGDYVWIMDVPPPTALIRQVLTATKIASGVKRMDYEFYDSNIADTLKSWMGTTSGIGTYPAAVAPVSGANQFEVLRAIYDLVDSLRYEWNTTRGITTWPAGEAPGTAGAPMIAGLRSMYDRLDSLFYEWNTTRGITSWPTAEEPAAGVPFIGGFHYLQNQMDTVTTTKLEYAEQMQEDLRDSLATGEAKINSNAWQYLTVAPDFSLAAWNTDAKHMVLDFPVKVEIEFYLEVYDSTELVCTTNGDSTFFEFGSGLRVVDILTGTPGATAEFDALERIQWPVPTVWAADLRNKENPAAPGVVELPVDGTALHPVFHGLSNGIDLGYEFLTTGAGVGVSGIMVWCLKYRVVRGGAGAVISGGGASW